MNHLITQLGGEPIFFLGDSKYFRGVLVVTSVWKELGWNAIIYIAAITGIELQLYEAATMDGAGKLKQVWYITLPGISNIIVIMFIFAIGGILNAGFEQIFLLYSPPVYEIADIIDTYVYRRGLEQMDYSYATAVGFFKSVVALILITATNVAAKKFDKDGIW